MYDNDQLFEKFKSDFEKIPKNKRKKYLKDLGFILNEPNTKPYPKKSL